MAGNSLFYNRRWLDPRVPDERSILEVNYSALCAAFPSFRACSKEKFLANVMEVCIPWSELTEEACRGSGGAQGRADREVIADISRRVARRGAEKGCAWPGSAPPAGSLCLANPRDTEVLAQAQGTMGPETRPEGDGQGRSVPSEFKPASPPCYQPPPSLRIHGAQADADNSGEDVDWYLLGLWSGAPEPPVEESWGVEEGTQRCPPPPSPWEAY